MKQVLLAGDYDKKNVSSPISYVRAVRLAGAVGAVGYAEDGADADALSDAYDALILIGGGDLPGHLFGQEPHAACSYNDPARDESDKLLLYAFQRQKKRVLGICRGCQSSNVYLGGTLHQHLPDAFNPVLWHSGNITGRHPAVIERGSLLASLVGAGDILVNSSHHQAIDLPGEGIRVVAKAPDGVIEAAEGENLLLLQWHPERMTETMLPVFAWVIGAR